MTLHDDHINKIRLFHPPPAARATHAVDQNGDAKTASSKRIAAAKHAI